MPMTEETFEQVVRRYGDMLYRVAYHALKNRADAEDVTQTVLLKLYQQGDRFESEEHRKHWLLRVAVNCANRFHASPWRRRTEPLSEALSVPAPEGEDLWEELRRLPEKDRTVLHLYYYEDMTTEEIAQMLDRNPATVRSQLLRARAKLKKLLVEEG